jgi:hypothetical protein
MILEPEVLSRPHGRLAPPEAILAAGRIPVERDCQPFPGRAGAWIYAGQGNL